MRSDRMRRTGFGACNDNGLIPLWGSASFPRGVISAAIQLCGPIAVSYVASGTLLITSGTTDRRAAAA